MFKGIQVVKNVCAVGLVSMTLCNFAHADVLGLKAGVVNWNQAWSGNVAAAEIDGNLKLADDKNMGFYAAFEPPIPFLPSIKIQSSPISTDGEVAATFTFDDESVEAGDRAKFDIEQQDVIAYAQILDNWISLDLGIAARRFDAEFQFESGGEIISDGADAVVPLLYGAARVDLPFSGAYVAGELMAVGFQGNSFQDLKLGVGYVSAYKLGGELGFRQNTLKVDEDELEFDFTVDGVYLALTFQL